MPGKRNRGPSGPRLSIDVVSYHGTVSTRTDARTHPQWKRAHAGIPHVLDDTGRCTDRWCRVLVYEDLEAAMPSSRSMADGANTGGNMVPVRFSGPITAVKKATRVQNAPPPKDHQWREP